MPPKSKSVEEGSRKKGSHAYKIVCTGVNPLLMDPMSEETLNGLITGTPAKLKKDTPFKEVARSKLYLDPKDGVTIGLPTNNLFACLVEAGKYVKYDAKRGISNSEESMLPGLIDIVDDFLPLTGGAEWTVDKRKGTLEATGGAVGIIRPRFDNWGFSFTVVVHEDFIDISKIRAVVEQAGRFKGLGSFRKKGQFGRFKIVSWVEIELPIEFQPSAAA